MFVADSEGAARARAVGRCEFRLMPALIREKGCCALSNLSLNYGAEFGMRPVSCAYSDGLRKEVAENACMPLGGVSSGPRNSSLKPSIRPLHA